MTPRASHRSPSPNRRRVRLLPLAGLAAGLVIAGLVPALSASATTAPVVTAAFAKSTSTGWGTAERGGAWTTSVPKGAKALVTGGKARFQSVPEAGTAEALLTKVSAADVDFRATIGLPSVASGTYTAVELRRQKDGSQYRGRLEVGRSGSAVLSLTKISAKKETGLGKVTLPFHVTPGEAVHVEFLLTGSSTVEFSGRAWTKAGAGPAWQIQQKDTSASRVTAAGAVGFWQYESASNTKAVTTTFDDISAAQNPVVTTPTTPATVEPTAPATDPARGSAAVGTTDYAVPTGALIVSPSGSDGAAGSVASPLRTLGAAVAKAVSGQTIVLRAGTYNESVSIPTSKKLTIQSYPHEAVWLDGSIPVTSWAKSGSTWTTSNWSFFPSSAIQGIDDNPRFVDPAHPLASRRDQVFYDGEPLTQVADAAHVTTGTFAVNAAAKTVTIGSDPAGKQVRISNQGQAIVVNSIGTTLQGFGVRRYASTSDQGGAVKVGNASATVRNLDIEDNAWIGLNFENNDETVDHVTVSHNGLMGVGANAAYDFSMTNSVVDDNNDQLFKASPVSGGVKITRSRGVTLADNEISRNHSVGFWCDESCYDVTATGNSFDDNVLTGMQLEISQKAIVADNEFGGGQLTGLYIVDTGDVQVYNNDFGATTSHGIQIAQDSRIATDLSVPGHDRRQPVPDPTMPWVTTGIQVSNNAFGASTGSQVYALNAVAKKLTITGNLFNLRWTTTQATQVLWGTNASGSYVRYDTPQALTAVGPTWKNAETLSVLPLSGMAADEKSAASIAVPLPADVAKAVDQPAGTKKVGTF